MRRARTLFVLGAGASKPFGFPVGDELRSLIIGAPVAGERTAKVGWFLRQCGYSESACDEFVQHFKRSGFSIDAFLARRPQFDEIGRVAISAALVPREEDDALYLANNRPGHSDWYQSFWLKLVGGATSAEELMGRQFKSISFNYDRSFERYLHLTAMSSFGLDTAEAYRVVKGFFPYHVYGQLGPYEQDTMFLREPPHVRAAAENLKVMPSTRPASDEACQKLVSWADNVYFLGFAFDPMNCALLGMAETLAERTRVGENQPTVYATSVGLSSHQRSVAATLLIGRDSGIQFIDRQAAIAMRAWSEHMD